MARRTSRKRTKYTWFPTIGSAVGTDQDDVSGRAFNLSVLGTGQQSVIVSPITYDAPAEPGDVDPTDPGVLAGIVGQEYFLKRIVGKFFLQLPAKREALNDPSTIRGALVGAGFFVARANDADSGGGLGTPIGSASTAELVDNYSPLANETIREPWIWRRTWLLGNAAFRYAEQASVTGDLAGSSGTNYPSSTADYGSVMDGPHIDAKCARRISQDERLWFAVAGVRWPLDEQSNAGVTLDGYLDYRLLAQLRKAHNRGVF